MPEHASAQVRSLAENARVYNDQSVNEHSHLSTAWALLLKVSNPFMQGILQLAQAIEGTDLQLSAAGRNAWRTL
jgi:hypothetical protein